MTLIQNQIVAKSVTKGKVLICGTRSFDEDMIKHCKNIGFNDEQIFKFWRNLEFLAYKCLFCYFSIKYACEK